MKLVAVLSTILIAGSIFASTFASQLPTKLASAGVPPAIVSQFAQGSGSVDGGERVEVAVVRCLTDFSAAVNVGDASGA